MVRLSMFVRRVFEECKNNLSVNQKLVNDLKSFYDKDLNENDFFNEFIRLLKFSLIRGEKHPQVEHTLEFVATFATSFNSNINTQQQLLDGSYINDDDDDELNEMHPFVLKLFNFLLDNHMANSEAVRYRSCQLINMLLLKLGEEACIDNDLYDRIYDCMLERLQDVVPTVRVQAVFALARLQEPKNKECPVIKAYLFHLSNDPHPEVRRAVLVNIGGSFLTLGPVFDRTRDIVDSVRKQAYQFLTKVHIKSLSIAQRERLLKEGLEDRSIMVRRTVENDLLKSWYRYMKGDVVSLLHCLDVESSTKTMIMAMKTLFKGENYQCVCNQLKSCMSSNDDKTIAHDQLTPERAVFWRTLVEFLREEDEEELLESILPELSPLSKYIKEYVLHYTSCIDDDGDEMVRQLTKDFISKHLFNLTLACDFSDEYGRCQLTEMTQELMQNDAVGVNLVPTLVTVHKRCVTDAVKSLDALTHVISEIRVPLQQQQEEQQTPVLDRQTQMRIAQITVQINMLRDEQQNAIEQQNFSLAADLKEKIDTLTNEKESLKLPPPSQPPVLETCEERTDSSTLNKCLTILYEMLQDSVLRQLTPTLKTLSETLVLPSVQNQDPLVRECAMKALAVLSIMSKDLAREHMLLFLQVAQIDQHVVQKAALRAIFDLLLYFGVEEFDTEDNDEEETLDVETVINLLTNFLDVEDGVGTTAAEGLCKLLVSGRIASSKLISRLIIMWYNPVTENDSYLRNMLGTFFELFATVSWQNHEQLLEAFVPTMELIFNAPITSPLSDIDPDDVVKFFIQLTRPGMLRQGLECESPIHDNMAFKLCTAILSGINSSMCRTFLRALNQLQISTAELPTLKELNTITLNVRKRLTDKTQLKFIDRFHTKIESYMNDIKVDEESKTLIDETTDSQNFVGQKQNRSIGRLYTGPADDESILVTAGLDSSQDIEEYSSNNSQDTIKEEENDKETDVVVNNVKEVETCDNVEEEEEVFISSSQDDGDFSTVLESSCAELRNLSVRKRTTDMSPEGSAAVAPKSARSLLQRKRTAHQNINQLKPPPDKRSKAQKQPPLGQQRSLRSSTQSSDDIFLASPGCYNTIRRAAVDFPFSKTTTTVEASSSSESSSPSRRSRSSKQSEELFLTSPPASRGTSSQNSKEIVKSSQGSRGTRSSQESRVTGSSQGSQGTRSSQESRVTRSSQGSQGTRSSQESHGSKGSRVTRSSQETRVTRSSQESLVPETSSQQQSSTVQGSRRSTRTKTQSSSFVQSSSQTSTSSMKSSQSKPATRRSARNK